MLVIKLHPKHCVRERLDNGALNLNYIIFFYHKEISSPGMGRSDTIGIALRDHKFASTKHDPHGEPERFRRTGASALCLEGYTRVYHGSNNPHGR